jgi:hypothetical protein
MNRRYEKGSLSVVLSPTALIRPVMVRRWEEGKDKKDDRAFDLFLSIEEAEALADALDDLLAYVETLP